MLKIEKLGKNTESNNYLIRGFTTGKLMALTSILTRATPATILQKEVVNSLLNIILQAGIN
jgi:hypothetical protein